MTLLSRVADHLFWGARYLERAEDTARLVRSYTELMVDLPIGVASTWEPLLSVAGSSPDLQANGQRVGEIDVVRFLVADAENPGSIVSSVTQARENLRTTREVLPREAWQAVNDLSLYMGGNAASGVERRSRSRVLQRVMEDCQRVDGVMSTLMRRDEAYELWRLGQAVERADMTTRVVGVRAAALLTDRPRAATGEIAEQIHDDVQWMGLLRSVSALQMYQRTTRGPIEAMGVVDFLLFDAMFPRSVASCVARIREALERLPRTGLTLESVDRLDGVMNDVRVSTDDGVALDAAMDVVQRGLADVTQCVTETWFRTGS